MKYIFKITEKIQLKTFLSIFIQSNSIGQFIIGGYNYDKFINNNIKIIKFNSNELDYNIIENNNKILNRAGCGYSLINNNVYIFSGEYLNDSDTYDLTDEFYKLDLNDFTWNLIPYVVVEEVNKNSKKTITKKSKITENIPNKPPPRLGCVFISLSDDNILLFGGFNNKTNIYYNDTWIYTISTNTWKYIEPNNNTPSNCAFSTYCKINDSIILFGGRSKTDFLNDCYIFNINNNNWEKINTSGSIPCGRCLCNYYLINESLILFGGLNEKGSLPCDIYSLNLNTYLWSVLFIYLELSM